MGDFLLVLGIAAITAGLTLLGVPAAELLAVPQHVVSAALQLAAGILTAIVAFSLMPRAVQGAPPLPVVLAFFVGGALFVLMEDLVARWQRAQAAGDQPPRALGLYVGILVDLVLDGVAIGIGSTLTLAAGLLLALGLAVSTAPLAFVTIATAKRQGMPPDRRRLLALAFVVAIVGGAMVGYLTLRNRSEQARLVLVALVSGFLLSTVTQSMLPEATREAEVGYAGLLFIGGLSAFALLALTVK